METYTFQYPFPEFQKHFQDLSKLVQKATAQTTWEVFLKYFGQFDDPLREAKCQRCYLIMSYMDKHAEEFNTGKFGVTGEKSIIFSIQIIKIVHHFYSHATDEECKTPPTPQFIMDLINKSSQ